MKEFKIIYRRENGTIGFETVNCKTIKLTKKIKNYFSNINADIIVVEEN